MPGPRKPETIRLEPARRQVFQWHFRENLPLRLLKQKMDQLSLELLEIDGQSFIAPEGVWEGRICYWNRRSPQSWNIKKRQRGPDVPIPAGIVHVPYWRAWDADVGDWARWKDSQLSKCEVLNIPRNPSITVSDAGHSMDQAPAGNISYWKAQEGQDWGLSSSSSESGNSHLPSIFSGVSGSAGSFSNGSVPEQAYLQDTTTDNTGSTSWLSTFADPWQNIFPPQLPSIGNYDGQQVFCDESLIVQPSAAVPKPKEAGFSHEANVGLTLPMDSVGTSYITPDNYGSFPLIAPAIQAEPRQLYMPPQQESSTHQFRNQDYDYRFQDTMAPHPLKSSSASSVLRLPPRDTVQHTMSLYGERMPWDRSTVPAEGSNNIRSYGRP